MMNFSNPKLSKRLAHFASFYSNQQNIWDIGCDHAQLGLSFLDHATSPEIKLVDPSLAVISKLQEKIAAADIPKVTIFHQSGQDVILTDDLSHFIFIAGMGGPEIISIMKKILPQMKAHDQLLISPHTKVLEVRQFLRGQGPWLQKEEVILEGGIWYPHFLLGVGGVCCSEFGEDIFSGNRGEEYREFLIRKLKHHRDNQSSAYLNFLCHL